MYALQSEQPSWFDIEQEKELVKCCECQKHIDENHTYLIEERPERRICIACLKDLKERHDTGQETKEEWEQDFPGIYELILTL